MYKYLNFLLTKDAVQRLPGTYDQLRILILLNIHKRRKRTDMTLADVEGQAEIQAYVQLLVWVEHTVAGFCPIHAETVGAYEHAES